MSQPKKIAILGTRYSPPHFRGGEEHVIHYLNQRSGKSAANLFARRRNNS